MNVYVKRANLTTTPRFENLAISQARFQICAHLRYRRRIFIRDFKMSRRRRQRDRQKSNKLNRQNNNNARAWRFFVHFFAVTARLRRENAYNFTSYGGRKQTTAKFSFSFWTWIGFLGIGSKTVHLLLTKYMSWSNRDRDWKNANSLFKRRFRGRRHRGVLNSLFLNPSNVTFRSPKKTILK